MKNRLLFVALLLGIIPSVRSQNTDLPGPTANLQTLPTDSYIVAMDNTNQLNSSADGIQRRHIQRFLWFRHGFLHRPAGHDRLDTDTDVVLIEEI